MFVFYSFRLLKSKPEASRRALSENSLLKNINFNEKFLGEEAITERKMSLYVVLILLLLLLLLLLCIVMFICVNFIITIVIIVSDIALSLS